MLQTLQNLVQDALGRKRKVRLEWGRMLSRFHPSSILPPLNCHEKMGELRRRRHHRLGVLRVLCSPVGRAERESFEQPVGNRRFSESIIQGDTSGEGSSNSAHPQTGRILGLKVSRIILPAPQNHFTQTILTASFTNFLR